MKTLSFKCVRAYPIRKDGQDFARRVKARKLIHKEAASRLLRTISLNKQRTVQVTEAHEDIISDKGIGVGRFIMQVFIDEPSNLEKMHDEIKE